MEGENQASLHAAQGHVHSEADIQNWRGTANYHSEQAADYKSQTSTYVAENPSTNPATGQGSNNNHPAGTFTIGSDSDEE